MTCTVPVGVAVGVEVEPECAPLGRPSVKTAEAIASTTVSRTAMIRPRRWSCSEVALQSVPAMRSDPSVCGALAGSGRGSGVRISTMC